MNDVFLEAAYRVLLRRPPDAGVQARASALYPNELTLIRSILHSAEFAFLYGHELQGPQARLDYSIFKDLHVYDGPGAPGFLTDFLGVRTSVAFVEHLSARDGAVEGLPLPFGNWHGDICEWIGSMKAVMAAKDRLIVYELGAGWAPWLVACAFTARQKGITNVRLTGVEGSRHHFEMMEQHFRTNNLDPANHRLLHAIAGAQDGEAEFPVLPNPSLDWGAAASFSPRNKTSDSHIDYRGHRFAEVERVPVYALSTLLSEDDRVDLVHIDIQGHEAEVVAGSIDAVTSKVKRMIVGTHSRALETQVADLLAPRGWLLELDSACRMTVQDGQVLYPVDGAQIWVNPAL